MYKVIIADDEPSAIDGLRIMVDWAKYGFEIVASAEDGEEALRLIKKLKPELVVLDIRMGELSGVDVTRIIKEENIDCTVMIVTAYDDISYAQECLRYGVKHYAIKPIDPDEFHDALSDYRRMLDKKYGNRRIIETAKQHSMNNYNKHFIVAIKHHKSPRIVNINNNYSIFDHAEGIVSYLVNTDDSVEIAANEFFERIRENDGNIIGCYAYGSTAEECNREAVDSLIRIFHAEPGKLYSAFKCGHDSISVVDFCQYANHINESISFGDSKAVIETIDELFSVLQKCEKPLQYAKIFYAYITIYLHREAVHHGKDIDFLKAAGLKELETIYTLSDYYNVLVSLCKAILSLTTEKKTDDSENMFDVVESYLKEHFKEQIVVRELAEMIYTSPGYLGTLFIKNKGMSIKRYIHGLRLEKAVQLMNEKPDMSLSEIASEVGYNNYNYFFLQFEKHFGTSPLEYKNLFKG